jgi:hypothetical protein
MCRNRELSEFEKRRWLRLKAVSAKATSRAAPSDVIALDHLFQHRHEVVLELAVDAQRRPAAREKLRSSATAMKYLSCRSSIIRPSYTNRLHIVLDRISSATSKSRSLPPVA